MSRIIKRTEEIVDGDKTTIIIYKVEQYFCTQARIWVDMCEDKMSEYTVEESRCCNL